MRNSQQHSPRVLGFVGSEDGQQVIVLQEVTDSRITAHTERKEKRWLGGLQVLPHHRDTPVMLGSTALRKQVSLALGTGVSLRQLRHTHVEGKKLLLKGIL